MSFVEGTNISAARRLKTEEGGCVEGTPGVGGLWCEGGAVERWKMTLREKEMMIRPRRMLGEGTAIVEQLLGKGVEMASRLRWR